MRKDGSGSALQLAGPHARGLIAIRDHLVAGGQGDGQPVSGAWTGTLRSRPRVLGPAPDGRRVPNQVEADIDAQHSERTEGTRKEKGTQRGDG
jgi:hypothetical protein